MLTDENVRLDEELDPEDLGKIEIPGFGEIGASFFEIDFSNIDEEISKQTGWYSFWSTKEAEEERRVGEIKEALKMREAEVWSVSKEDPPGWAKQGRGGYPTVDDLNKCVDLDGETQGLRIRLIDAEEKLSKIKAIRYTLQQRKDMISSRMGLMRTEMEMHMREMSDTLISRGE